MSESYLDYLTSLISLLSDPVYYGVATPRGKNQPILLIPGLLEGDCSLAPMRQWLARIGYRPYLSGIYWNLGCLGAKVEQLAQRLDVILRDTGAPMTIIGHSLGGMLARLLGAVRPDVVGHVIMLGAPTRIEPTMIRREIRPALLAFQGLWRIVADAPQGCGTLNCICGIRDLFSDSAAANRGFSSIYTRDDDVVDWRACLEPGGDNFEVSGKHCSLIVNTEVYRLIAAILASPMRALGRRPTLSRGQATTDTSVTPLPDQSAQGPASVNLAQLPGTPSASSPKAFGKPPVALREFRLGQEAQSWPDRSSGTFAGERLLAP